MTKPLRIVPWVRVSRRAAACLYLAMAAHGLGLAQESPKHPQSAVENNEPLSSELAPSSLDSDHLPNLIQLHPHVISGGQPSGDAAFRELADRGVKTIISVDGATPNVLLAKRLGMRYVHLPHGYDGIGVDRARDLAKAVRDLDGPIYIHCHHGKHRSPAAATVACVTAGLLPPSRSLDVLQLAGTDPKYRGLYRSVTEAHPVDPAQLDEHQVDYREVAAITPMATSMLALERTLDELLQDELVGPATRNEAASYHPVSGRDAHENALLLREHFTELIRAERKPADPAGFLARLQDSEAAAAELVQWLDSPRQQRDAATPPDKLLKRIIENCTSCHADYRN